MFDKDKLAEINRKKEIWQKTTLQKTLDRFSERREEFVTTSSAPVERLSDNSPLVFFLVYQWPSECDI